MAERYRAVRWHTGSMATDLTPSEALAWVFARPRTAKLGVVTKSGAPLVAPIWVARDGDTLVFNTGADTAKGRALARDPRVSLCFDDETPPFAFVIVNGTAEIIEEPSEVRRWAAIIGVMTWNFSRYWRRFSATWASSFQAAAEAACTVGLMAQPW